MSLNENLKRLYQSYPENEFYYKTLSISHSTFTTKNLYRTSGLNVKFFTEPNPAGGFPVFISTPHDPSEFTINDPNNEANSNSEVTLSFGVTALFAINQIIDAIELDAIKFLEPIKVIYKVWHSDDVDVGPSMTPVKYYVRSINLNPGVGATLTLTTTNNLKFGTGDIYSIADFPGLVTNG